MNTILLIEDNIKILNTNREFLESEGYSVYTAATLEKGRQILKDEQIDLLILDIMLPDGSGIDLCDEIRKQSDTPVLYLTCLEEDDNLVAALKAGGDEYMTKPYSLAALSARVMALLRRVRIDKSAPGNFGVGPLTVDFAKRIMYMNGNDMLLKPKEFELLLVLLRSMGKKFTSDELYSLIWTGEAVDVRTVVVHISLLRKKLYDSPFYILTDERKYYSLCMD